MSNVNYKNSVIYINLDSFNFRDKEIDFIITSLNELRSYEWDDLYLIDNKISEIRNMINVSFSSQFKAKIVKLVATYFHEYGHFLDLTNSIFGYNLYKLNKASIDVSHDIYFFSVENNISIPESVKLLIDDQLPDKYNNIREQYNIAKEINYKLSSRLNKKVYSDSDHTTIDFLEYSALITELTGLNQCFPFKDFTEFVFNNTSQNVLRYYDKSFKFFRELNDNSPDAFNQFLFCVKILIILSLNGITPIDDTVEVPNPPTLYSFFLSIWGQNPTLNALNLISVIEQTIIQAGYLNLKEHFHILSNHCDLNFEKRKSSYEVAQKGQHDLRLPEVYQPDQHEFNLMLSYKNIFDNYLNLLDNISPETVGRCFLKSARHQAATIAIIRNKNFLIRFDSTIEIGSFIPSRYYNARLAILSDYIFDYRIPSIDFGELFSTQNSNPFF